MLVVTTWLPTRERPEVGSFVLRDIEMLVRDHDVHVLHLSPGGTTSPMPSGTASLTTVHMSPANPISVARAARAVADRADGVDLVHTMAASALLPFRFFRPSRPWVHTEHWSALLAPSTVGLVARAAIPLTVRLLARPDVVIAVGHRLASAIGRHRSGPTVVIPNAVERPVELRERPLGSSVRLAAVGGLIARKGPDIAVRTIAELRNRGVDARIDWVGEGPLREEVTLLAEQLGVAERVRLRGTVPPSRVPAILAESDAFLLPTTMETFGVAIAEALVSGRPVVVGADGEQASFVKEPDGVLVHEQTASAYADGVQRVLAMNASRSAREIAAQAASMFDAETRRGAYSGLYEAVAARRLGDRVEPDVDVVIAVHDARRRIDRAVRSVLSSDSVSRVIVICHGIAAREIDAALVIDDPRVELTHFQDGIRSPAGPFNRGIELATGRYLAIVGSDDELTPGAIDAWRRTAERDMSDVVMAPLRHAAGGRVPTPPTWRGRRLQGARDRLAYRTAPLGLVARDLVGGLRFTEGLATGEDLAFSARLWFGDARVSRHRGAGEYLIHDGDDRVTFTFRPLSEELRAVELLIRDPWARRLSSTDRTAVAAKLWRVNVFGAVHYRAGSWTSPDRLWLADLVRELHDYAPPAFHRLSRADAALAAALRDTAVPDSDVDALSRQRRRFVSAGALVPVRTALLLAREAPLRFSAATWWASRA